MVPNGWERIKLKDIGNCLNGLTYSPKDVVENGLLVLRSSNIQNSNLSFLDNVYVNIEVPEESRTRFGDIILCVRNGSKSLIGKSAFIGKSSEGLTHGAFMSSFRSNDTPEYTFQLFQSPLFFKQVNQNLGATINSINNGNLYNFNFPYPPIEERKKIATILGTWDNAISTTERLIDNSKQQKKALMQQLLTGKKRLLDDSGKPFEGEWEEVKFGDCISHFGGTALEKHVSEDATHHFISIGNYSMDGKYVDKGQRVALNEKTSAKLLQKGELVMVLNDKTKTGDIIGSTILIDEYNKYIYNQRSERIIPKGDIYITFFWFLLNSSKFRAEVFNRSQGGTQIYINFSSVKAIQIKLPSILEQKKIASVLTNADKEIDLLEKQLADLKQEKKALMQQLLTGKRRVKVDDEALA